MLCKPEHDNQRLAGDSGQVLEDRGAQAGAEASIQRRVEEGGLR